MWSWQRKCMQSYQRCLLLLLLCAACVADPAAAAGDAAGHGDVGPAVHAFRLGLHWQAAGAAGQRRRHASRFPAMRSAAPCAATGTGHPHRCSCCSCCSCCGSMWLAWVSCHAGSIMALHAHMSANTKHKAGGLTQLQQRVSCSCPAPSAATQLRARKFSTGVLDRRT